MKNVIFYFSGTGNTYNAAKKIADSIGDCELISIPEFDRERKIKAERVGICYPIYYWGLPNIIKDFAASADIEAEYIFELHTMGGYDGVAVAQLEKILSEKNEKLSASYAVKMPNNIALISKSNRFTDVYRVPDEKSISMLIKKAGKKLSEFSEEIKNMKPRKHRDVFFAWHGYGYRLNQQQTADFHNKGAEFSASLENNCMGCGKCSEVCPMGNISIVSGKPIWNDKCQFCLACLHACPQKAINYGYSKGKERYAFPKTEL